jgi:hypothetical protein
MMSFQEFVEEPEDFEETLEELEEGIVRSGALIAFSGQSKTHGDKAEKHFRDAITALNTAPAKGDPIEHQLIKLEKALFALSAGLIEQRKQIGSGVAVNLTGHLLTNKSLNSMGDERRR